MKLPLANIVHHEFADTCYGDKAIVIAFHPATRYWELAGKYPGGLSDIWLTPSLDAYGIEPEFTPEELARLEELRSTNQILEKAKELKVAIENWFAAPHLR